MKILIIQEPERCRLEWEKNWPVRVLFDLWPVRSCFYGAFSRPLSFHMVEQDGETAGFMPLCWNEEAGNYVQFPGETWQGKTWLEQNRLIAKTPDAFRALLDSVPGRLHLRYLNRSPLLECLATAGPDETGYLFYPRFHNFSFENYRAGFSGKSKKKLKSELKKIEALKPSFRFNRFDDLSEMYRMNIAAFKEKSYFYDIRFYRSFESLASFLRDAGMLRITAVLIKGEVAAVDMGAVFKNTYTLLAGGTHPGFPGIAKFINLHHLEWSCRKRFDSVDFLCGDFNWKQHFHLTPRPLYEIRFRPCEPPHKRRINETANLCA